MTITIKNILCIYSIILQITILIFSIIFKCKSKSVFLLNSQFTTFKIEYIKKMLCPIKKSIYLPSILTTRNSINITFNWEESLSNITTFLNILMITSKSNHKTRHLKTSKRITFCILRPLYTYRIKMSHKQTISWTSVFLMKFKTSSSYCVITNTSTILLCSTICNCCCFFCYICHNLIKF